MFLFLSGICEFFLLAYIVELYKTWGKNKHTGVKQKLARRVYKKERLLMQLAQLNRWLTW